MRNVELLNKLKRIQEIMYDKPDEAMRILRRIRIRDIDLEDFYEFTVLVADMLYYDSQFDRAIGFYKKALGISVKNKNEAKCYYRIGCSYYEKGIYSKAIKNLEKALKVTSDKKAIQKIYLWLALAYKDSRSFNNAIKILKKLINLFKEQKDSIEMREGLANAYVDMSICYWRLHDHARSEDYFNRVVNMSKVNLHILAWAYAIKAHRLFEDQNWKEAAEYYEKAIGITDSEENKRDWQENLDYCEEMLKDKDNR